MSGSAYHQRQLFPFWEQLIQPSTHPTQKYSLLSYHPPSDYLAVVFLYFVRRILITYRGFFYCSAIHLNDTAPAFMSSFLYINNVYVDTYILLPQPLHYNKSLKYPNSPSTRALRSSPRFLSSHDVSETIAQEKQAA